MARIDLSKLTKAQLIELLREASTSTASSEASAHYTARDIPCSAKKPCSKTFRTIKGRDWHVENVKH